MAEFGGEETLGDGIKTASGEFGDQADGNRSGWMVSNRDGYKPRPRSARLEAGAIRMVCPLSNRNVAHVLLESAPGRHRVASADVGWEHDQCGPADMAYHAASKPLPSLLAFSEKAIMDSRPWSGRGVGPIVVVDVASLCRAGTSKLKRDWFYKRKKMIPPTFEERIRLPKIK